MIYKTNEIQTKKLLSLPESGMGYQLVQDTRTNRSFIIFNVGKCFDITGEQYSNLTKKYFFNEKVLDAAAKFGNQETSQSALSTPFSTRETSQSIWGTHPDNIKLLQAPFKDSANSQSYNSNKGAAGSPKEKADGNEIFVRLSVYEDDKRIDFKNRKLLPGTYTTTLEDYRFCIENSKNPVERYALPGDEEIRWAFFLQPKFWDILQRGIVQPAFGHRGGGIEAYFENGTSENTYICKTNYGN